MSKAYVEFIPVKWGGGRIFFKKGIQDKIGRTVLVLFPKRKYSAFYIAIQFCKIKSSRKGCKIIHLKESFDLFL